MSIQALAGELQVGGFENLFIPCLSVAIVYYRKIIQSIDCRCNSPTPMHLQYLQNPHLICATSNNSIVVQINLKLVQLDSRSQLLTGRILQMHSHDNTAIDYGSSAYGVQGDCIVQRHLDHCLTIGQVNIACQVTTTTYIPHLHAS